MHRSRWLVLVLLIGMAAPAAAADIALGVGQSRIVNVPGFSKASELELFGPIEVTELGDGWMKVTGTGPGQGSIRVGPEGEETEYAVTVASGHAEDALEQLVVLLKDIDPPLEFRIAGGRIIVEGTVKSQADRFRFERVMEYFPDAINMVRVEAKELLIGVSALLIEVERTSGHDLSVLDLDVESWLQYEHLEEREGRYYPRVEQDLFRWGVRASADLVEALKAEIESGTARVVARPRVVTVNGEKATLLSGGELPYEASGFWGAETRFKPYGIRLEVVPELLPSGEVMMDLLVEAGEPAGYGVRARRAQVRAAVEKGRSLMLAGLSVSEEERGTTWGFFFPLFGSRSGRTRKELLVMVTPTAPSVVGYDQFEMIDEVDVGE